MKYFAILVVITLLSLFILKKKKKNTEDVPISRITESNKNSDKQYTVVVKTKKKEDKTWSIFKDINVKADSEYSALLDAAYLVAGSDNPRINQASLPISATVVLRSQNISYRFEIKDV